MPPLREIYQAPKRLGVWPNPVWVESHNGRLNMVVTLENMLGVTVEGMLLRGRAIKDRPDEEVMLQLECPHDYSREHNAIERIDWNPLHNHNNGGNGPEDLRFLLQKYTHRHSFDLNWLEEEQRMRYNNLPIAEPVAQPLKEFEDLIEFCGKCFGIENLGDLPPPPWVRTLL